MQTPDQAQQPRSHPPRLRLLYELFTTTFVIGALTFGGGYAMIPLIDDAFVNKKGWITEEEMLDIIAISQMVPGPLAISSSTFVGIKVAGFWGGLVSAVGVALPSLLIICVLSTFYLEFKENRYVSAALQGIRAGVVALVLSAVLKLGKKTVKRRFDWAMAGLAFALVIWLDLHPVAVILIAGLTGWLVARREAKTS
ncbi:MAG: chromate transporter [Clostridiales bacterium]|nr:chromate transporter [Clostridiales bacterium]